MATVSELAFSLQQAEIIGDPNTVINGATHDSRQVQKGYLFAVLKGSVSDGRDFVPSAIEKGAFALLVEERLNVSIPQVLVENVRIALGAAAAVCYGDPTAHLKVVGVTGTNGKTTTVYLVEAVLNAIGALPGVMTTVECRIGEEHWKADHTTPEAPIVQANAKKMLDKGATHMVLEASSHGLALGRLNGCHFDVVAFTNLTRDHLDFHRDMDDYGAAKLKLFTERLADNPDAKVVVNIDDAFSSTILRNLVHPVLTISTNHLSRADIRPLGLPEFDISGIKAGILTPQGEYLLDSPLIGLHNLSNLLTALAISIQLGIDPEDACRGLSSMANAPGRLDRVQSDRNFAVFVDYAHTPDALDRVLKTLRKLTLGKLICVFGCGGDRDKGKRPKMGQIAGEICDIVLITSDNPRTEEPMSILDMIAPGAALTGLPEISLSEMKAGKRGYIKEIDRTKAIEMAMLCASPKDTVLIAGKGHEDYQILGTEKIYFDDRLKAKAVLDRL